LHHSSGGRLQRIGVDMTKEALKLALEALESCDAAHITDGGRQWYDEKLVDKAITAIKEALAQPEQEPVAWILEWIEDGEVYASKLYESERRCRYDAKKDTDAVCRPLVYGDKLKEKNNG
jgi:hypothetical protein